MQLKDMLIQLSEFYPLKGKNEDAVYKTIETYKELILGEVYKSGKEYDYEKLLKTIQLNRIYQTFPTIPEITKYLPECLKEQEYIECKDEGKLILIELPNGYKYEFTVSNMGRNYETIKEELKNKYYNCKITQYPKGTVIIGDKVI